MRAATGAALALGVGPSHAWYVRDQLGLPCASPLRHSREHLSVLRPLLRGERARYAGEFLTVDTGLDIGPDSRPAVGTEPEGDTGSSGAGPNNTAPGGTEPGGAGSAGGTEPPGAPASGSSGSGGTRSGSTGSGGIASESTRPDGTGPGSPGPVLPGPGSTAPPPALLLAALGPRMLDLARELADGIVATWVTPEVVADYLVPRAGNGARVVANALVVPTTEPDRVREAVARQFAAVRDMPAYRALFERTGIAGPAETAVVGDETAIARALARFRDAGATDLVVTPLGSAADRARTLDVAAAFAGGASAG